MKIQNVWWGREWWTRTRCLFIRIPPAQMCMIAVMKDPCGSVAKRKGQRGTNFILMEARFQITENLHSVKIEVGVSAKWGLNSVGLIGVFWQPDPVDLEQSNNYSEVAGSAVILGRVVWSWLQIPHVRHGYRTTQDQTDLVGWVTQTHWGWIIKYELVYW